MSATVPTPTGYLALACLTWLVYDYLLTLDDEIELIWRRRWSFTKAIFLLMRWSTFGLLMTEVIVYVFIENLSKQQCDAFSWGSAIATFIVVIEVEIVLQLRIFVMYERSRKILWTNAAGCVIVMACAGVVVAKYFPQSHFVPVPDEYIGACYSVRPGVLATVWIAPMLYELYLAALAVYKAVQDYRAYRLLESSILAVLVRDSVVYFVLLVIVAAVNITSWVLTKVTPGSSTVNLVHAAGAVGGARLILSMRAAVLRPSTMSTRGTIATMGFKMGFKRNHTGTEVESNSIGQSAREQGK